MRRRRAGIAVVFVGAVLILTALLLFLYKEKEEAKAFVLTEQAIQKLEATRPQVPELSSEPGSKSGSEATLQATTSEMTTVAIDGYDYIGIMEIPVLEKKLPVMSEWDYTRLKIAPCRQFGALETNDLVIAAHNYEEHFGTLAQLRVGDEVIFTDTQGQAITYRIERTKELAATAVDAVQNSDYDLVLYTCTPGGAARVGVFCNRKASEATAPLDPKDIWQRDGFR